MDTGDMENQMAKAGPQPRNRPCPPRRFFNLLKSEQGSFALFFALTLMFFLTVFAWVLDTGSFIREKNRYQACAEAAALAAVNQVCFISSMEDLEELVMDVVRESHLDLDEEEVVVETGYYDAFDEYDPFDEFKDFIAVETEGYPTDETWNAVKVTLGDKVNSLTGFQEAKSVKGAAVAYLPRVSMVSKNGSITSPYSSSLFQPQTKSFILNGNLYAKDFSDLYPVSVILGDVSKRSDQNQLPELKIIENHLYPLDVLIKMYKKKADKIYTMADRGKDAFYGFVPNTGCAFDFSYSHDEHEIIFIDTSDTVHLNPFPEMISGFESINHSASGNTIKNLTIISENNIELLNYNQEIQIGGSGFDQLNIISGGTINFYTEYKNIQGVNFISNSFYIFFKDDNVSPSYKDKYVRIIAESDIKFEDNLYDDQSDFDLKFGPPCPPAAPPCLGRLESP